MSWFFLAVKFPVEKYKAATFSIELSDPFPVVTAVNEPSVSVTKKTPSGSVTAFIEGELFFKGFRIKIISQFGSAKVVKSAGAPSIDKTPLEAL